ncbi:MAG: glycosyltransferase [Gluconacetobacter diazotrophicus]|nr:glycosyltransferase [Gluconacetobacter diazotrophicus]
MRVSVLTLVRGRDDRLRRVMDGLNRQTRQPDELVVAHMQERPPAGMPDMPFPVRCVRIDGEELRLAAARNAAAAAAGGGALVFLDVDCIPHGRLVAGYLAALDTAPTALLLGEVRYLPRVLPERLDDAVLAELGARHPARPAVPERGLVAEPDHGQLWGLSFALSRATWNRVGGMDERFVGYGGEETDLAARLAETGVAAFWAGGALAFHQHHPVHAPPLNHFGSILRNATLFRERHGRWCMRYWLDGFAAMGLIRLDADRIELLRPPSGAEVAASLAPPDARWG